MDGNLNKNNTFDIICGGPTPAPFTTHFHIFDLSFGLFVSLFCLHFGLYRPHFSIARILSFFASVTLESHLQNCHMSMSLVVMHGIVSMVGMR